MRFLLFSIFFAIPALSFAATQVITKEERVMVPSNQSVEQVKEYTGEKLFREAAEEAGVAISTSTLLVDGKISKDEVKTQTSAIAQKKVNIIKQETVGDNIYITVRVTASVDSGELDAFLRQIMQNEALKKALEDERKEKLELEAKLKKASKEEYGDLSRQAERIAKAEAARLKQLEIDMANASQALMEAERRQKREELEAAAELEKMKREYYEQDMELKKRIANEQNAAAKAEMEYQALLAELSQNAIINDKTFDLTGTDTVDMLSGEAARVRVNFSALVKEFSVKADKESETNIKNLYHDRIALLKSQKFPETPPAKGEWDNNRTYNDKKAAYQARKDKFERERQADIEKLEDDYKKRLEKNSRDTKEALYKALTPLYARLEKYNTGTYSASNTEQAVISFGERDLENLRMPITVEYKRRKYRFVYEFGSLTEFRTMYETRGSFRAVPLFGLEPKGASGASPYLNGFRIVHLGNKKEKFFSADASYKEFPEIAEYKKLKDELYPPADTLPTYAGGNVYESDNTGGSGNRSYEEDDAYVSVKKHSSDLNIAAFAYQHSYFQTALEAAFGTDVSNFTMELNLQYHWRFNRWLGMYLKGGFISDLKSGGYSGYGNWNYWGDRYYWYYRDNDDSDDIFLDYGAAAGLGLDVYLGGMFMLFAEIDCVFLASDNDDNDEFSVSALIKGGIALQSKNNTKGHHVRFSVFAGQYLFNDKYSAPMIGIGLAL